MPFRFRKIFKIAPGLKINMSKSGFSTSIGGPGASMNFGKKGIRTTIGIPGSGISYSSLSSSGSASDQDNSLANDLFNAETISPTNSPNLTWIAIYSVILVTGCCLFIYIGSLLGLFNPGATPTPTRMVVRSNPIMATVPGFTLPPTWTPTAVLSRTPIPPPTRRATWTPEPPTGTPLPIPKPKTYGGGGSSSSLSNCSCNKDTYNCNNFPSQNIAQACLYRCWALGKGDIHKLDRDHDGLACDG